MQVQGNVPGQVCSFECAKALLQHKPAAFIHFLVRH